MPMRLPTMEPNGARFVQAVMETYNEYSADLGIIDVYVYEVPGRNVKATAMIILRRRGLPRTLTMYYLADGTLMALIDVSDKIKLNAEGQTTYVTIDLYSPPEEVQLALYKRGKAMFAASHEFNEDKTYLIKMAMGHIDSIKIASIIKELMDSYDAISSQAK